MGKLEMSKIEKGIWGKNSFKKKFEIEFLKKFYLYCKKPFFQIFDLPLNPVWNLTFFLPKYC